MTPSDKCENHDSTTSKDFSCCKDDPKHVEKEYKDDKNHNKLFYKQENRFGSVLIL